MKWLGRALACGSWLEAETDLACNEPYWNLCFKLGLLRRTLRDLRQLLHCVGSLDSPPTFRGRDSGNLHLATLVPSAPAGQTLRGWRRERSWRLDGPEDRLCATAQCQRWVHPQSEKSSSLPCRRTSSNAPRTLLTASNLNCCDSNSVRAATVPIRSRAL
jgi:hypothetical protein